MFWTMKKIILINALLLICSIIKAQDYRPLGEFGTDTIAYMHYNFVDRKDQYIGQPFKKLINDCEWEPFRMDPTSTYPYAPGAKGKSYVYGADLKYLYPSDMIHYRKIGKPFATLEISFPPPHPEWEIIQKMMPYPDDDRVWALKMGDMIIEDIKLLIEPSN